MHTTGDFEVGSCIKFSAKGTGLSISSVVLDKDDRTGELTLVAVLPWKDGMKCYRDEDADDAEKDRVPNDGCHSMFPDILRGYHVVESYGFASFGSLQKLDDSMLSINGGKYDISPIFVEKTVLVKMMEEFGQDEYPLVYGDSGMVRAVVPNGLLELYKDHPNPKTYHIDSKSRGAFDQSEACRVRHVTSEQRLAEFEDFVPGAKDLARSDRSSDSRAACMDFPF